MTPIDPVESTASDPKARMAPPYVDEDPNLALVQQGVDEAENEIREAITDDYEADALSGENVDEELDDIDFSAGEGSSVAPEVAAVHEEDILPEDEEDI